MLSESAAPQAVWVEEHPVFDFVRQTSAVAEAELRKLRHDHLELVSRMVQPVVWLVVFGRVFSRLREVPTGGIPYLDFMAPGILAQSVLLVAVFFGVTLIWERDLGILQKFLVSPANRLALVLGKSVSAGIRAVPQAGAIYLLALLMGVHLWFNPVAMAATLVFIGLGAALFSTMSLIVACLAKTRQRFMGVNQLLIMPLFFGSNAIYPLQMMPGWLQRISAMNPLTYMVDGLRAVMLREAHSVYGLGWDVLVLAVTAAVLLGLATKLYPRVIC
ncbi:MAG: ABC transporter permease [Acidobacteriia bacterium]|nr:ABC transporter permease [Terriglobia bacterium]